MCLCIIYPSVSRDSLQQEEQKTRVRAGTQCEEERDVLTSRSGGATDLAVSESTCLQSVWLCCCDGSTDTPLNIFIHCGLHAPPLCLVKRSPAAASDTISMTSSLLSIPMADVPNEPLISNVMKLWRLSGMSRRRCGRGEDLMTL